MPRISVEPERREQILEATCAVLAEVGFRSLRVTDVARRAGLSSGIIHYYFETKRDLLHAAFEWNFTRSLERRRALLDQTGGGAADAPTDSIDVLRAFVASYLPGDPETTAAWHVWAELWVQALHEPDLQELNDRVYGEWRAIVTGILAGGQRRGQIRDGDPTVLANALIAMIDGLSLQVLLQSPHMTAAQTRAVIEQAIGALLPG